MNDVLPSLSMTNGNLGGDSQLGASGHDAGFLDVHFQVRQPATWKHNFHHYMGAVLRLRKHAKHAEAYRVVDASDGKTFTKGHASPPSLTPSAFGPPIPI